MNQSTNTIDQSDFDCREVPLNGFNRFDPRYVSIGPKALRENSNVSVNKCATLRHAGRYGGSLSERGINPVLKKASPPSVAVSKKPNDADIFKNDTNGTSESTFKESLLFSATSYGKRMNNSSRCEYPEQKRNNIVLSDKQNYKMLNSKPVSVYSIEASTLQKSSDETNSIKNLCQLQNYMEPILANHGSKIPDNISDEKSNHNMTKSLSRTPAKTTQKNISIVKQPLSASNLEKFRPKKETCDKNHFRISETRISSTQEQCTDSSFFNCQAYNKPPSLPPKNKNKVDQLTSIKRYQHSNQNRESTISNTKQQFAYPSGGKHQIFVDDFHRKKNDNMIGISLPVDINKVKTNKNEYAGQFKSDSSRNDKFDQRMKKISNDQIHGRRTHSNFEHRNVQNSSVLNYINSEHSSDVTGKFEK